MNFKKIIKKIGQDVGALVVGAILSYGFVYIMINGSVLFTADMMNQYGEVVSSLSGSEMLYDISTGGQITVKTTKDYKSVKKMIFTMYFDQDSVKIDTGSITSNYKYEINRSDNTLIIESEINGDLPNDTSVLTFKYSGQDAWRLQTKSVFIAIADMGEGKPEDLVVFTNTPPNPNPDTSNMRE